MIEHQSLEVNIVRHCVNKCVSCSHAAAFSVPYVMAPETLWRDLCALRGLVHVKELFLLGGEPLLHPQLELILGMAKDSHIADSVGVITNGKLLFKMDDWFWSKIDSMRLSIYPNLDPAMVTLAREKALKHGFNLIESTFTEFYKQFMVSPDGTTFNECPWRKGTCWTVHEGYFYLCPQSAFFPDSFMGLPQNIDGLPLANLNEVRLLQYINRTEPFVACRICGGYLKLAPWREASTRDEWVKESTL